MTNKKFQLPLALLGLTARYTSKLKPVLAHSGHSHSAASEPKSTDLEKVSQPLDETNKDVTEAIESQANQTTSEKVPTTAEITAPGVSTAKLADGFSLGLGEAIFGLMIAAPFLLLSLKKVRQ